MLSGIPVLENNTCCGRQSSYLMFFRLVHSIARVFLWEDSRGEGGENQPWFFSDLGDNPTTHLQLRPRTLFWNLFRTSSTLCRTVVVKTCEHCSP